MTRCSYEFCDSKNKEVVYNSGYCNACYQRLKYNGFLQKISRGQSFHPLYNSWNEKRNEGILCDEWKEEFFDFLDGVGDKPSADHRLKRPDKSKPYGPNNFEWLLIIRRLPGETVENWNKRKWQAGKINRDYRNKQLQRNFGIDIHQYNKLLKSQNYVCAICEQSEKTRHHKTNELKSLAVDHCHKTGKVRGLLCQRCNRTLGKINDSILILDKMKDYLNAHNR